MPLQYYAQFVTALVCTACACGYHKIQTAEVCNTRSKTFPYCTFDPVPGNGIMHRLARDRQAKTGEAQLVLPGQHDQEFIAGSAGILKNALKFLWPDQPVFSGEGVCAHAYGLIRRLSASGLLRAALSR